MFWALAAYFVIASLVAFANLRASLYMFIFGYIAFPFATALGPLVYQKGLFAFDLYFPLVTLAFLVTGRSVQFPTRTFGFGFVVLLIFLFISAATKLLSSPGLIPKAFYLDLRVPIVIIESVVLFNLFRKARIQGFDALTKVALVASVAALVYWTMNYLGLFTRGDLYYDVFNRYRFWSTGSTVGMVYVLYCFVRPAGSEKFSTIQKLTLVLSGLATLASGQRAPVLILTVAGVLFTPYITRKVVAIVLIAVAAGIYLYVGSVLDVNRINSATTLAGAADQLANRFGPAMPYLVRMKGELLYGFGFGSTFNIPWFSYRDLDTDNSTVDSMYLTYFVKFGLMSILLVYLLVVSFTAQLSRRTAATIAFFFLFQGIFYVMPAHPHFLAYQICACLIGGAVVHRKHAADAPARHRWRLPALQKRSPTLPDGTRSTA